MRRWQRPDKSVSSARPPAASRLRRASHRSPGPATKSLPTASEACATDRAARHATSRALPHEAVAHRTRGRASSMLAQRDVPPHRKSVERAAAVKRAGHSLRGRPARRHAAWTRRVNSAIDGFPAPAFSSLSSAMNSSFVRTLPGSSTCGTNAPQDARVKISERSFQVRCFGRITVKLFARVERRPHPRVQDRP